MMKAISLKEFMKKDNQPEITWKYDKDYLSSYKDGKEMGYNIHKNRCLTKEDQFMWIQHMGDKSWVNTYKFTKEFIKALKSWNLWKI
jgi:hydrogenase maturation factor HypF (carbamoyltransferase family)